MNDDESKLKPPPRVSKAPPPITTLRGTGGGMSAHRRGVSETEPVWRYWLEMPHADLWMAVALSCNLEPRKGRFSDWWREHRRGPDPDDTRYEKFLERLEISLARTGELEFASLNFGEAAKSKVKLPQFAGWAVPRWDIPKELADMAMAAAVVAAPPQEIKPTKGGELGTTERGTVLKIIAGFLVHSFKSDEIAKPYSVAKEILGALQSSGLNLSDDTIAPWIKEASKLLESERQKPKKSK